MRWFRKLVVRWAIRQVDEVEKRVRMHDERLLLDRLQIDSMVQRIKALEAAAREAPAPAPRNYEWRPTGVARSGPVDFFAVPDLPTIIPHAHVAGRYKTGDRIVVSGTVLDATAGIIGSIRIVDPPSWRPSVASEKAALALRDFHHREALDSAADMLEIKAFMCRGGLDDAASSVYATAATAVRNHIVRDDAADADAGDVDGPEKP